jgi:hypothetical protein
MANRMLLSAFLVLVTSIGGLYIFMATFGGAMDGMYYVFQNLTPQLAAAGVLSPTWNNTAARTLTYWQFFYRSVVVIMIAMGVWVVRVAIIDIDYTRQQ